MLDDLIGPTRKALRETRRLLASLGRIAAAARDGARAQAHDELGILSPSECFAHGLDHARAVDERAQHEDHCDDRKCARCGPGRALERASDNVLKAVVLAEAGEALWEQGWRAGWKAAWGRRNPARVRG